MAGKTIAQKYSSKDKARLTTRQILSHSDDSKAIYYEYEEKEEVAAPRSAPAHSGSETTVEKPATQVLSQTATLLPGANTATQATSVSGNSIEDAPLSATDVVLALTGQKLKRPLDEVSIHESLRDLSGGDLTAEFGNLPEDVDNITLESLGASL
ncbi:hypothetical protein BDR22DRAFT_876568 [Usnea florida]